MRRIFFFNRCYWPDNQATGQLLTELCEFLAPRWDVSVVVGQPNWVATTDTFVQTGVQTRNDVDIYRLNHHRSMKGRTLSRIRNFASFTMAVRRWGKTIGTDLLRDQAGSPTLRPTIVCETDPFLLPLVVGPMAKRLNARMIYYLQDIYPDVALALEFTRNSLPVRILKSRLRQAYMQADRIIVLDEDMRDRLGGWGIPIERIRIVPNWMDCSKVKPIKQNNGFRIEHDFNGKFVVMHSGNMGMTQRLDNLVTAMKMPIVPDHSMLSLLGQGSKRSSLEAFAHGQSNVRFMDYQPKEYLATSLSAADLHVVSMDNSITGCMAPSKLYGILASGTPVLAIVPKGNAVWRLVERERLGWTVEPNDCEGIARAIVAASKYDPQALVEMGKRGRALAIKLYDKQICCEAFEAVLNEERGISGIG